MTPEQYYYQMDTRDESKGWKMHLRHWECIDCGKMEMDSQEHPDHKIRDNRV